MNLKNLKPLLNLTACTVDTQAMADAAITQVAAHYHISRQQAVRKILSA